MVYPQFEKCNYDGDCIYKDTSGECIWETCLFEEELPKHKPVWSWHCVVCGEIVSKATRDVKTLICDSCLQRIKKTNIHVIDQDCRHEDMATRG